MRRSHGHPRSHASFSCFRALGCLLALLALPVHGTEDAVERASLRVQVTGVKRDSGPVYVTLHQTADSFPGEEADALATLSAEPVAGVAEVVFEDVPAGSYAIALYHDENGDGKLNLRFGMFPKEGTGFSNNARPRRGPPRWSDAVFEHGDNDSPLSIEMVY